MHCSHSGCDGQRAQTRHWLGPPPARANGIARVSRTGQGTLAGQIGASLAAIDLVVAGVFLRVGGQMLKGPYLPETMAGLTKTTRALLGR